ncbi:adenosylcobalamin-dependent ribonucleoside-diphosphate reductase [archaeon]|jgi:ribonucleoside-diphosphate reductase alpha chain|nr:adenosylcobalamin-dependent ribonucleoside-diphosphate reductase [archaeon]MBT6698222.1 adenosylcobalamin-dependent ribonucleoside-diphosphate reductase [archaeon]
MITHVQKADGTTIEFDKDYTLQSISSLLSSKTKMPEQEAMEIAQNVVEVISNRGGVPSTKDFEAMVNLVVRSAQSAPSVSVVQEAVESEESQVAAEESSEVEASESQPEVLAEKEVAIEVQKDIAHLNEHNVMVSSQAESILNGSVVFDELGRSIFLDRYALKTKRDNIEKGDLVIAISKEDPKYPKKDLGIVTGLNGDDVTLHMITGVFADAKNNYEFKTTIWKCDKPIESISDAHRRVAKAAASVEKDSELQTKWEDAFYSELAAKHIQPAGRIMTAANVGEGYTKNLTLYNCYVIPSPKDSREGIIKETLHQMTEIFSRGGGVGINLSTLRPRYAYVRGVHGKSSGAVSWGGIFSYGTGLIEQGGSRRGALMLMLHDWHPDILEFITAKRKKGVLENANISVMFSDRFMAALAAGEDWPLEFPDYEAEGMKEVYKTQWDGDLWKWKDQGYPTRVYKTIPASEMWDMLVSSAHASAEPGIVFMERYNKMSNSNYYNPIICTNPCGEQGLPAWGVCNLGHLYLASFCEEVGSDEKGKLYEINWSALRNATRILQRFLDNVIDLTPYHFEANEKNQKGERRVGLGTLGLGEMLIKLRVRYGSSESLEIIDKVYEAIANETYLASVEVAKEKGMFPFCEPAKYIESGYMKTMSQEVRDAVLEHGIRNVTLTTQAPTGTVGTMLGTSTGIEPYYAFEFFRQSRLGFHKQTIPLAAEYADADGNLPDWFVTAMQMSPLDHIRVQAAVQRWTDSSISKTANAPENFTIEQTKQLYEEAYRLGCKGVTIYRDNCRYEQVLTIDAKKEESNANSGEWEASSEVSEAEVSVEDVSENLGVETSSTSSETNVVEASLSAQEGVSEGSKCEMKFDENGQMFKSCSD